MSLQCLLVIDRDAERRRAVATGLSEFSFEVAAAVGGVEGIRFCERLEPAVVVAVDSAAQEDPRVMARLYSYGERPDVTFLLVGSGVSDAETGEVPDHVLTLPAAGLDAGELVPRLRLVLLGHQLHLAPDLAVESLIGDLSRTPFFGLLPALGRAGVSGWLELPAGEIALERGVPIAAQAGAARGLKAFCRLAAAPNEGLLCLRLGPTGMPREIVASAEETLRQAVEETLGELPDPRRRIELQVGRTLFEGELSPLQRQILAAVGGAGVTLGALLDAVDATDGEIRRELLVSLEGRGLVRISAPEAAETAVAVVTDSSCDLPKDLVRSLGIHVVPLSISFGQNALKDGVDLDNPRFYARLAVDREHPTTQPPAADDFRHQYLRLASRQGIVSIHLSSRMSETWSHARQGALDFAQLEESAAVSAPRPRVIDSAEVSLPLGLLCIFAARMAQRGLDAGAIAARLETLRGRVHSLFVVNTLEYLARGGRIGRARALVGQWLSIKPILGMADGEVAEMDRARGGRAAQQRILELFEKRLDPLQPVIAAVAHAAAPVWAERLRDLLRARFQVTECVVSEMGPVVGTHVGPGTVGAALFQPTAEELALFAPL